MFSAIVKIDTRTHDEITHSASDEDFVWSSHGCDPRRDMHGNPREVLTPAFALAGVDPGADFDP